MAVVVGGGGGFVAHLGTLNGIMSFPGLCLLKCSESQNFPRHKLDPEADEDEEDEEEGAVLLA